MGSGALLLGQKHRQVDGEPREKKERGRKGQNCPLPGRGSCSAVWFLGLLILTLLLLLLGQTGTQVWVSDFTKPTEVRAQHPCSHLCLILTCSDSWKDEAWYCAYLAMVVCERELSQGQICLVPVRSQFSSEGCCTWVRTSTVCSPLASTRVLVEKRPKSEGTCQTGCPSGQKAQLTPSLPGPDSDEVGRFSRTQHQGVGMSHSPRKLTGLAPS